MIGRSGLACVCGLLVLSGAAQGAARNFKYPHVADQLIVKFKPGLTEGLESAALASFGGVAIHKFSTSGALLAQMSPGETTLETRAEALAARPDVQYVEANTILHIDQVPNDPQFGELYGMNNMGDGGGTVDADIDAPEAWDIATGSRNVLVGIIDTGVDYNHPDIKANYWTNPGESGLDANGNDKSTNGIDDDGNGYIDDFRGWDFANNDNDPVDDHAHGTHCAGTIGGSGNNGEGVVGVNWEVSIVAIKFLTGAGSGSLADAVKAIEYGTKLGVTLTSNSWGGGGYSDTMEAAIKDAGDHGILFIAAAGNDASNNDASPHFPSSYPQDNVIAVAATDRNDAMASFSGYGLTSVDVGAPGVDILSSVLSGAYNKFSGTSMATPHVSGLAALIKSAYPDATAAQIKARIINTADPVPALQGKTVSGGRINAYNALENDTIGPNLATDLTVDDAGISSIGLKWTATGDDGDVGAARRYEIRYAAQPILTDLDWDEATKAATVAGTATAGQTDGATIGGLPFNSQGYVALKAVDNVGNVGPLSASLPFAVRPVARIGGNDAETMDGVTADAPWGLQAVANGNAFSDSPNGNYADNANVTMTLPEIAVNDPHLVLTMSVAYDLEAGYDFGYVEASADGGANWTELEKLNGTAPWTNKSYDLSSIAAGATSLTVRFRLTSDFSISKDGMQIDNISLYAPAE